MRRCAPVTNARCKTRPSTERLPPRPGDPHRLRSDEHAQADAAVCFPPLPQHEGLERELHLRSDPLPDLADLQAAPLLPGADRGWIVLVLRFRDEVPPPSRFERFVL